VLLSNPVMVSIPTCTAAAAIDADEMVVRDRICNLLTNDKLLLDIESHQNKIIVPEQHHLHSAPCQWPVKKLAAPFLLFKTTNSVCKT